MDVQIRYNRWLENTKKDSQTNEDLKNLSPKDIEEAFMKDVEFGTGGLRGKLGVGPNRMNSYVVRRATQGFASCLKSGSSVAIAYDSRNKSDIFAKETASVFAANGITAYIFPCLMPTPTLSFAVRQLGCEAGVVITASHNPAIYNGYKAYGADGCQITLEVADKVLTAIRAIDEFDGVRTMDFDEGIKSGSIKIIGEDIFNAFLDAVYSQSLNPTACEQAGLKVVYTPLNGAGNKPVRAILSRIKVDVSVVSEQENPDGNFPTCAYPNPEEKATFRLAEQLAETVQPDLLLATDPDCDRVGISAKNKDGSYSLLSGNDVGLLLTDYILSERQAKGTLPKNPIIIKTIVTTDLTTKIAAAYGAETIDVLTGFKFIGEQIGFLEQKGEKDRYVFGFEESYGYLAGTHARDKDAVVASMLICEMAAVYKLKGITLPEALGNIYKKYGYSLQNLKNFVFEGVSGMDKMKRIMSFFRETEHKEFAGREVTKFTDYQSSVFIEKSGNKGTVNLPKSDVVAFELTGGLKFLVRPSGTEPKMKAYLFAHAKTESEAQTAINELMEAVSAKIDAVV
jgi:phosphoglucomutase